MCKTLCACSAYQACLWCAEHAQPTLVQVKQAQGFTWHAHFQGKIAPKDGEKGYKPPLRAPVLALDGLPCSIASGRMLEAAQSMREDGFFGSLWENLQESPSCEGWSRQDVADLLFVPRHGGDGAQWTVQERWHVAGLVMGLSLETMPDRHSGQSFGKCMSSRERRRLLRKGKTPTARQCYISERVPREDGAISSWLAQALMQDMLSHDKRKRIVEVSKQEAARFIAQHHSHLPYLNPRGLVFCLGLMVGQRLVAVATASTPSGRWSHEPRVKQGVLNVHNILELTRVASDGTTRGASSMLVSRLLDVLERCKRGGGDSFLLVTYQLSSEEGTTYKSLKGKGLRPVSKTIGKRAGGTGARKGSHKALCQQDKVRWEAGSCPLDANWSLIQ